MDGFADKALEDCVATSKFDVPIKELLKNAKLAQFKSDTEGIDIHQAYLESLAMK